VVDVCLGVPLDIYAVVSLFLYSCPRNRICVVSHYFAFGTVYTVFGLTLGNLYVVSMFVFMPVL